MAEHELKADRGGSAAKSGQRRRRRKPRSAHQPDAQTPAQVIARAAEAKPGLESKWVEEPLSADELAELRQHLKFLREHRRVLHLRVNAQEDLLLNEVRQPTRRGVCLHLLSKVDRAQVFSAAERLDPAAATRLAEGVLRISPNLDYLLLYLDCVRRSQSGAQAVAALAHALEQIDFRTLSAGQMRRVLDLVVELFDARQLPMMLLGLLESHAFREAFDACVSELPAALAELVVPLRAAQAVVLHKKPNRFGAEALVRGVRLLLASDEAALSRRSPAFRRRLLDLAIASGAVADAALTRTARTLLDGLGADPDATRLALELARAWVSAARDDDARQLLQALARSQPEVEEPRLYLEALDKPRLGRVAVLGSARDPGRGRMPAVFLDTLERATLLFLDAPQLELLREAVLPGVAPVLASGSADGRTWVAVARPGQRLSFVLERRRGTPRRTLLRCCAEAARLLAALGRLGIRLPDARLARFELDDADRLWLTDTTGASRSESSAADAAHARLIARFCRDLFASISHQLPRAGTLEQLDACPSATLAADLLARDVV